MISFVFPSSQTKQKTRAQLLREVYRLCELYDLFHDGEAAAWSDSCFQTGRGGGMEGMLNFVFRQGWMPEQQIRILKLKALISMIFKSMAGCGQGT